jgi:hypothetical protein
MGRTQQLGNYVNGIFQDASNNIGIGGSPSGSYKFEVTGTGNFSNTLRAASSSFPIDIYGSTNNYGLRINNVQAATLLLYSSNENSSSRNWGIYTNSEVYGDFDIRQSNAKNGDMTAGANGTSRFYIKNNGFVGIGTTNPITNLHIKGSTTSVIYAVGASNAYRAEYQVEAAGQFTGSFIANPSASSTYGGIPTSTIGISTSSTAFVIATSEVERMRITSGGVVGIGGSAGSGRLQVWGESQSSANYAMYVYNSGGFGLFGIRNDGAQFLSGFTYGNTVSGGVRTLYIDSTYALGGISSVRASKKNIQEFNSDWIYNLKPVEFNYRKKDEEGNYTEEVYDEINYGLIAEDTAPIADFLINYNDKEDGTKEMVGIEYPRLIVPLLKAIQELSAKVSALENKS